MSDLLQENLTNLHDFWHVMADTQGSEINIHSTWPNKIWHTDFRKTESNEWSGRVHVTKEKPRSTDQVIIKSTLKAMYLDLNTANGQEHEQVMQVCTLEELKEWCNTCAQAFGYEIDMQALIPLFNDEKATILAFQVNGKMVATAILYQSMNNMGIHQVGVLPSFQGGGIGKKLMHHLVAVAKNKACKTMTLQASQAAISMYLTMGFVQLIDVYHLESNTF